MTREELIDALEKAEAGSRELDRDIALLGEMYPDYANQEIGCFKDPATACGAGVTWAPPDFTTSIDAALTLVPEGVKMWKVQQAEVYTAKRPRYRGFVDFEEREGIGRAPTPALALCIAALKARA